MENISSIIEVIGLMTICFAVGRILSRCLISLEDQNKWEYLQKILMLVSFALYFLSAPIGIMYFLIEIPEYNKQSEKYEREIRALEVEQINLKADCRTKCTKIKDASFASGYRYGYKDAQSGHAPLYSDNEIAELTSKVEDYNPSAYEQGYDAAYNEGYEDGLLKQGK